MESRIESNQNKRVSVDEAKTPDNMDNILKNQIDRQKMLLELGKIITSEMNLEALFDLIIRQTNGFMDTEQCSVFLFDDQNNELWALVSTDLEKDEIRIPANRGVTGWVFENKTPLMINDAYNDQRFLSDIDRKTGFRTRNILSIPLINRKKQCIGTLQTLNKKTGAFTQQDQELLISAAHYVAVALENAKLYEDLKLLDKAKEKVINHLSHELKTPLSIIYAALKKIHDEIENRNINGLDKTLARGRRNVGRLMDLQLKIDDILGQRPVDDKVKIMDLIETAAYLVRDLSEGQKKPYAKVIELISGRLESLFSTDEAIIEDIHVRRFLDDLCDRTLSAMGERELRIVRNFDDDLHLSMDRGVLQKICEGLLKNAIENTPDEGKIVLTANKKDAEIEIRFHDYGIGITSQNKEMIFGGFFHTQHTDLYSTKRPYAFGAGGAGSDLLRAKCFSERYGFTIEFESIRCKFIPDDKDLCPGRLSKCTFISGESECLSSGESIFLIKFRENKFKKNR